MQHEVLCLMQSKINALQAALGAIRTSALWYRWASNGRLAKLPVQVKGGEWVTGLWSRATALTGEMISAFIKVMMEASGVAKQFPTPQMDPRRHAELRATPRTSIHK